MSSETTKRPWLAAVLAAIVTGLGHLYLRRWLRAAAWFLLVFLTVLVFVPEGAVIDAGLLELAPVVLILGMSVIDAYMLARSHNERIAVVNHERCSSCGRELDPDDEFCWYCAEPLEASEESGTA